jgi:hypothetical protein
LKLKIDNIINLQHCSRIGYNEFTGKKIKNDGTQASQNNLPITIKSRNFHSKNEDINRIIKFVYSIQDSFNQGDRVYCVQDVPEKYLPLLSTVGYVFSVVHLEKPNHSRICSVIVVNPHFVQCSANASLKVGFQLNLPVYKDGVTTGMLYLEFDDVIIGCVYDPWISNITEREENYFERAQFMRSKTINTNKQFVAVGDFNPRSSIPIVGDIRNKYLPNNEITEIINLIPMFLLAILKSQFGYKSDFGTPRNELKQHSNNFIKVLEKDTFILRQPLIKQGVDIGWTIDACQSTNPNVTLSVTNRNNELSDHKEIEVKNIV